MGTSCSKARSNQASCTNCEGEDPAKAREVLARLVSDRRMEAVWTKLYRTRRVKNKNTEEFVHPAYIKYASRAAKLRQLAGKATAYEAKALENEAAAIEDAYDPLADQPWSDQDLGVQLLFGTFIALLLIPNLYFLQISKPRLLDYRSLQKTCEKRQQPCDLLG